MPGPYLPADDQSMLALRLIEGHDLPQMLPRCVGSSCKHRGSGAFPVVHVGALCYNGTYSYRDGGGASSRPDLAEDQWVPVAHTMQPRPPIPRFNLHAMTE